MTNTATTADDRRIAGCSRIDHDLPDVYAAAGHTFEVFRNEPIIVRLLPDGTFAVTSDNGEGGTVTALFESGTLVLIDAGE